MQNTTRSQVVSRKSDLPLLIDGYFLDQVFFERSSKAPLW